MAKATITPPPPPVERVVTLELTETEAAAIQVVLGRIEGDTKTSPRRETSAVYWALYDVVDTKRYAGISNLLEVDQDFHFNDYPKGSK